MAKREIERWITVNGVHIPVYKGDNVKTAIKRNIDKFNTPNNKKSDDDIKEEQIIKNKEQADKASNKESFILKQDITETKNTLSRAMKAQQTRMNKLGGKAYEETDTYAKYEIQNSAYAQPRSASERALNKVKEVTGYDDIKVHRGKGTNTSTLFEYSYKNKKIAEFRQRYDSMKGTLKIYKK